MPAVYGPDVSHHQGGSMDFAAMLANDPPMSFCIARSSYGKDGRDSQFGRNWGELRLLDGQMVRGVYHFAYHNLNRGRSGGEAEALNFVSAVKPLGGYGDGCLPPFLDFEKYAETDPGYPRAGMIADNLEFLRGFLNVADNEFERKCGIYTGANVWKYQADNTAEFSDRVLWQVAYSKKGADEGTAPPTIAGGEWIWDLWQWSGGSSYAYFKDEFGVLDGGPSSGVIDMNRVRGGRGELEKLSNPGGGAAAAGGIAAVAILAAAGYFAGKK